MRKKRLCFTLAVATLILVSGLSFGQAEEKTWGSYLFSGTIGVSYLFDDIQGDKNLFLSQFNLKKGVNIPEISFRAYKDPEKEGFLDVITFDVAGFGAEPYGRAVFRLERRNVFFLTGGYIERKYFADIASFANPLFAPDSDEVLYRSFHTWDAVERVYDLNGGLRAFSWLRLNASWQRTELEGNSLITLRLLNNEFPLNEPVNQKSDVFRLTGDIQIKNVLFYRISGIYQNFDLDQSTSSEEDNVGIRGLPTGSASIFLSDQLRKTTVDLNTWVLDQSFRVVPMENLTVEARYKTSQTDGTASGEENIEGRFIWPLSDFVNNAAFMNSGDLKKDFNKADAMISFNILPELRLRAGYNYYQYKIENSDSLDLSYTREYNRKTYTESRVFNPLIRLKNGRFFADADLAVGKNFTAGAGYAYSQNDLDLRMNGQTSGHTYKLNSYYADAGFRLSTQFSLKISYKRGDYDKVLARRVPLEAVSYGLQSNFKLKIGLSGTLFFRSQGLENSTYAYSNSFYGYGGSLQYQIADGTSGVVVHFSRNDLDSTMEIVRFVSVLGEIEDISTYTSNTAHLSASIWLRWGIMSLDGGYSYTKNSGTFPMIMEYPYLSLAVKIVSDLAVNISYRRYSHNQELFESQNYKANLFNIGFMYKF